MVDIGGKADMVVVVVVVVGGGVSGRDETICFCFLTESGQWISWQRWDGVSILLVDGSSHDRNNKRFAVGVWIGRSVRNFSNVRKVRDLRVHRWHEDRCSIPE